ncbi:MAG TPA: M1 family aminopeptidase [Thermoanaerobaculia bacterium]
MTDRLRRAAAFAAVSFLAAAPAFGAGSPAPAPSADPTYAALRAARPEGPAVVVNGLTIERDAFRFRLVSGVVQFLTPVSDRVFGAVFVGDGRFELEPASASERRHLAFLAGDPRLEMLTDSFETAVFLFTDATAEEIRAHGAPAAPPASARDVYEKFFKRQRKDLKNNLQIRLLEDLLEERPVSSGVFLAGFPGKKLPPSIAIVDPQGLADWFSDDLGGESVVLYVLHDERGGYWYSSHSRADVAAGRLGAARRRARAERYAIDTTIARNTRLQGRTDIFFKPRVEGLRVLPVALLSKLRVKEASLGNGESEAFTPVPFVQEDEDEDADFAVVMPRPLIAGQLYRLRVEYEGKDVLQDAGDGNFVVGARDSWYPNLGTFTELARYDLTYHCPKALQIVSVGELVEDRVEGDQRISIWKSDRPFRVAGFNYGKFRRRGQTDSVSGLTVEVYTNPGEPDFLRQLNFALENRTDPGLRHVSADPESLASAAIADGINTARVGTMYYGPLPDHVVSITQQTQAFFGQSWPTLVYLPYIAAFDATIRHELGLQNTADFVDLVGPHEFAHQWWGHRVGWASYRDQWLSEGFAEFTAALVLQFTEGVGRMNGFWEKARRRITMKPRYASVANDEAGPITDGWRLSTWRNRSAAQVMIYSKGAYILHMLRALLRDPDSERPDERFIALMQDFVKSQEDRNPTTRDFQDAVERHMTPELDVAGDGKMDWFFRQWVSGTEIPRFETNLAVAPAGEGRYAITGTVAQSGVSPDFRTRVPVYAVSKGEARRVGFVTIVGNATAPVHLEAALPKPPDRAVVNALHDVLSRD